MRLGRATSLNSVRIVVATCSVDYAGRLTAHLPKAKRLLMFKADGSVLVHSDGGSYKPLTWMSPPATVTFEQDESAERWTVQNTKTGDQLVIRVSEVHHDSEHALGVD